MIMASGITFNMSDKALLVKLHEVALKNAGNTAAEKIKIVNSGISNGSVIDEKTKDFAKIELQDSSKIKYFSSKDNLYQVGIIFNADALKKHIHSFSTAAKVDEELPVQLYSNEIKSKYSSDADKMRDIAYKYIVRYMTAFCGDKYAKSIPKDKIICEAYGNENDILKVSNGVIGSTNKKYDKIEAVLYKIGYSVGAK